MGKSILANDLCAGIVPRLRCKKRQSIAHAVPIAPEEMFYC